MTHALILHPADPHFAPAHREELFPLLHNTGFLGTALATLKPADCFEIGPKFLDHITYLGCSPTLHEQTYICFPQWPDQAYWRMTSHGRVRCRHCKQSLGRDVLERGRCAHCAKALLPDGIIWRREGVYARCQIEVLNVDPHIAVPGQGLLDCLKQATGQAWQYAYAEVQ